MRCGTVNASNACRPWVTPREGNCETLLSDPLANLSLVVDLVTLACNLRCGYCHEGRDAQHDGLDRSAHDANAAWLLARTHRRRVQWVLHGGEPLLVGRDTLGRLIDGVQAVARYRGIELTLGLQTNGTLIDEAWAGWLADRQIRVSVSLDGPPSWNDVYRAQGRDVERAICCLRDAGLRPSVVCLLTAENVGRVRELWDYFRTLGTLSVRFNLCWPVGRGATAAVATAEQWIEAKATLLAMMIESRDWSIDRELGHLARQYSAAKRGLKPTGICSTRPCGAGRRVVALSPARQILACGRAQELPHGCGVLADRSERPSHVEWWRRVRRFHTPQCLQAQCNTCLASNLCTVGCPSFLWRAPGMRDASCRYWKGICGLFEDWASELVDREAVFRQPRRPQAAGAHRNREAAETSSRDADAVP